MIRFRHQNKNAARGLRGADQQLYTFSGLPSVLIPPPKPVKFFRLRSQNRWGGGLPQAHALQANLNSLKHAASR